MTIELKKLTEHSENQKIYGYEGITNLQEKIEKSKWIKPIIVAKYSYIMDKENVIISGHRRYYVAKELNYDDIPFSYIELKDKYHEIEMLLLENEYRDKTKVQKVREAERWEEIEKEKARERISEGGSKHEGNQYTEKMEARDNCPDLPKNENSTKIENNKKTENRVRDNVASKVGFNSGKDYERSKKVVEKIDELESQGKKEEAKILTDVLEHSTDGALKIVKEDKQIFDKTIDKIKKTGMTNKASKVLSETKLDIKKKEILQQTQKEITENKPKIKIMDCKEYLETFEDNSIDLLITDPPYSTDIDDICLFIDHWLPIALQKVKQEGRLYICIGAYPKEIHAYLNFLLKQNKFIVDNPLVWTYRNTLGVTPKMKYNLNYQIILHLFSGKSPQLDTSITNEIFSVQDINAPDGRLGNRFHTWQKPDELANRLIRHGSKINDLVVDCFACTGTFLIAAAKLNRQAEGCEILENNTIIAKEKGCIIIGQ